MMSEKYLEGLLNSLEDATIFLSRLGLDGSDDYRILKEMYAKYVKED